MHMADALLSPAVGGAMYAISTGTAVYAATKLKKEELDEKKVPMMGVMGAFVFAAQMINFTIPATGSSGHIGGGILLAALLGPYAAFLTISAVLMIQCLFFADGGLLALGCNIFNMGFLTCFLAYPLLYKPIVRKGLTAKRITMASVVGVVIGLQLGAFSVVLETLASGVTELPFSAFVALMQPIHLAIGLVEGLVTAAVLNFVYQMRPEIMEYSLERRSLKAVSLKKVMTVLVAVTIAVGGFFSLYASGNPDGLEWSMEGVAGTAELSAQGAWYQISAGIQEATAFLPDYSFKQNAETEQAGGTSTAGIVGGVLTFALAACSGLLIAFFKKRKRTETV